MELSGRVALVTGATRGIGRAVALELAARGARLVLTGRTAEGLDAVACPLRAAGTEVHAVVSDVTAPGAAEAALGRFGRIDVLVNNAGVLLGGTALDCSDADWEQTFATNVTAVFRFSRAAVRAMSRQGSGAVVNVASD